MLKYLFVFMVLAWSLTAAHCYASPYEDADNAYEAGDYHVAYKMFKELAEQGNAKAQSQLGFMYLSGQGVTIDDKESIKWLYKAALQGEATAQNNLGSMLYRGKGGHENKKEAVSWWLRAAAGGHVSAQAELYRVYMSGDGVEVNRKEGIRWLKEAAKNNHPDAVSEFNSLVDGRWYDLGGIYIDLLSINGEKDNSYTYWIMYTDQHQNIIKQKLKINCKTNSIYLNSYAENLQNGELVKLENGDKLLTKDIPPSTIFEAERDMICR